MPKASALRPLARAAAANSVHACFARGVSRSRAASLSNASASMSEILASRCNVVERASSTDGARDAWYDCFVLPARPEARIPMSHQPIALPPQIHVFVRDWLSSNNVLLKSEDGDVVIDSGYVAHAPLTLSLLSTPQALGSGPLAKLVNTHCHSDHMGGNAAIKARHGCPIAVPEGEVPLIDAWEQQTLLLAYADQRADRFQYDEVLKPGASYV